MSRINILMVEREKRVVETVAAALSTENLCCPLTQASDFCEALFQLRSGSVDNLPIVVVGNAGSREEFDNFITILKRDSQWHHSRLLILSDRHCLGNGSLPRDPRFSGFVTRLETLALDLAYLTTTLNSAKVS